MTSKRENKKYSPVRGASVSEDSLDNIKNNNLDQLRDLPQFLEKINQNIMNIDNKISNNNRENFSKGKGNNNVSNPNQNKNNAMQECFDIKNLVKQSIDGLNDIFNIKMTKNVPVNNVLGSCRNVNNNAGFEIIEEEPVVSPALMNNDRKKDKIVKETPNNTNNSNNSNVIVNSKRVKSSNIETNNQSNNNQVDNKKKINNLRQMKSKLKVEVANSNLENHNEGNNNTNLGLGVSNNTKSSKNIITPNNNSQDYNKNKYSSQNVNKFIPDTTPISNIVASTPSNNITNISNNKQNNTKTPQSLREKLANKITNKNFIKSNTSNVSNVQDEYNVVLENIKLEEKEHSTSNLIPNSSNPTKINITPKLGESRKRNMSSNKRYENEEKENKSKSPLGSNKNYVLKPKVKKQQIYKENIFSSNISKNMNNSNNNISLKGRNSSNTNNESTNNYLTELNNESNQMINKKVPKRIMGYNKIHNTSTSRNKNKEANPHSVENNSIGMNSSRNNIYHNNINNATKTELNIFNKSFKSPPEFEINSFVKMILLFNEINQNSIKETNDKFISEDMSKLLTSLVDPDYSSTSDVTKIVDSVDSKFDIAKVTIIQRHWRNFKILKKLQILKKDQDSLNKKLKNNLLDSIKSNENFNEIFSIMNNSLFLFNSITKNNENFTSMINDYLILSKDNDTISKKDLSQVHRNFLTRGLKINSNCVNMKNNLTKIFEEKDKHEDLVINSKILNPTTQFLPKGVSSISNDKKQNNKAQKLSKSYDIQEKLYSHKGNTNLRNLIYMNSANAAKDEKSMSSVGNEEKDMKTNVFENNYFIDPSQLAVSTLSSVNLSRDNKGTYIVHEKEISENNFFNK